MHITNGEVRTQTIRAWEREETFNEVLYEWMSRGPWVLISAALHFVLALILATIPWNAFQPEEPKIIQADLPPPVEELEEEEIEPEVEIEEPVEEIEPIIEDYDVSDHAETDDDLLSDQAKGEEGSHDAPFDAPHTNSALGIGGGGGSKMGGRIGGGSNKRPGGVPNVSIQAGLRWLADHQDADGKWDCDEFSKHDPASDRCDGAGDLNHDVGVTGLALLAFLGDGHTTERGAYANVVKAGVIWLTEQQDPESGLFGDQVSHSFLYDHAIATLALCEACYFSGSPTLKAKAQKAVEFITHARNPYRVWRYAAPGNGQNDTSVTGWMVFALKAAQDCGVRVDVEAFHDSLTWFDDMTDGVGRVGYQEAGESSSRIDGRNGEYPTEGTEALTAVTLLCRFFLGQDPEEEPRIKQHADLLLAALPEWSDDGMTNDMYYWYYGSYAMYQMDGEYWKRWERAMKPAVIDAQRSDGAAAGSWDPNGPWGFSGGRVYSTATMVLCLEVYYRYGRMLGSR